MGRCQRRLMRSPALALALGLARAGQMNPIHLPPTRGRHSVQANFSFIMTHVSEINEQQKHIEVYADMLLWWRDPRWHEAAVANFAGDRCGQNSSYSRFCGLPEAEAGTAISCDLQRLALTGNWWPWQRSGRDLWRSLTGEATEEIWTPVPSQLQPRSDRNLRGKTDAEAYLYNACFFQSGPERDPTLHLASWEDSDKTTFDIDFSYVHFPFDSQELSICVPFNSVVDPQLEKVDRDLGALVDGRSAWGYEPSDMSPLLSARVATELFDKGFNVDSIKGETVKQGNNYKVCVNVGLRRRVEVILLRLFGPMTCLMIVPFAGFYLPVNHVMPRVATGFISFLSLQVFRTMAYNLLPQKSSSLLWIDVAMFCVTEIMFLTVLQNVVAQVVNARFSAYAARHVDRVSELSFPAMAFVELMLLLLLGHAQVLPEVIMMIEQLVIVTFVVGLIVGLALFSRRLPRYLLTDLARELSDEQLLWRDGLGLDAHEFSIVFRCIDSNRSGFITADEILASLKAHGLKEREGYEAAFKEALHSSLPGVNCQGEVLFDLDAFRKGVQAQLSGKLVRRMAMQSAKRNEETQVVTTAS